MLRHFGEIEEKEGKRKREEVKGNEGTDVDQKRRKLDDTQRERRDRNVDECEANEDQKREEFCNFIKSRSGEKEKERKLESKGKGDRKPKLWSLPPRLLTSLSDVYSDVCTQYSSALCDNLLSSSRSLYFATQTVRNSWNQASGRLLHSTVLFHRESVSAESVLEDSLYRLNLLLSHSLSLRTNVSSFLRRAFQRQGILLSDDGGVGVKRRREFAHYFRFVWKRLKIDSDDI